MIFESSSSTGAGLISALASLTGSEIENGILVFPETFGKGYMKFYDLGRLMRVMINQVVLNEDITLKRTGAQQGKNEITFSFRNIFPDQNNRQLPSVQVSSSDIDIEVVALANTRINTILIIVHTDLLKDLFNQKNENTLLQNIISGKQPYLYDEIISAEIQQVAAQIIAAGVPEPMDSFYIKLKAQEMIYLFFVELLKRRQVAGYSLNAADVKMMYLIRDKLIEDLGTNPNLSELTRLANMSESKMNRLFKQIFGNSIYAYYQLARMIEAAYLIKKEKLSVSEAGYRLGFTNLSHFTRIFEKHIGLKPKKYAAASISRSDNL
ncbi:AraC family transcriptional regulator [Mucilaginibacter dorajii]|uniref:AraC family transcriptional regulator n=1 Tax=Mucilaginibacter dorajii TaxID=692994 RepID=A0ABP7P1P9_9SPHI|nr:AraC family transcriptional regulator [Mucilaginibacter dorajii]MCS3737053.1 AraC-like DNA-binding protein [Mucilaginibacter dorajii]